MKKIWFIALMGIALMSFTSCGGDDEEDTDTGSIVGTWTATESGYDLYMDITSSGFRFDISKPGQGGTYETGRWYEKEGTFTFVGTQNVVLAQGKLKGDRLTLTLLNPMVISMLGSQSAGNIVFTRSGGGGGNTGKGYLVVQNLSENKDIVKLNLYDANGYLLSTDEDRLEPGYQFTYEVPVGDYIGELTAEDGRTFRSGVFKIIKGKYTVLRYDGSSAWLEATGIDMSPQARNARMKTFLPSK
ncbi:MAG: hypothetical protein SPI30_05780 [Prevotella sp.]|nr:hypothetical protein [Prevotella sp.]